MHADWRPGTPTGDGGSAPCATLSLGSCPGFPVVRACLLTPSLDAQGPGLQGDALNSHQDVPPPASSPALLMCHFLERRLSFFALKKKSFISRTNFPLRPGCQVGTFRGRSGVPEDGAPWQGLCVRARAAWRVRIGRSRPACRAASEGVSSPHVPTWLAAAAKEAPLERAWGRGSGQGSVCHAAPAGYPSATPSCGWNRER